MSFSESLVIIFIAIILLKPDSLGTYIAAFKKASKEINAVKREANEIVNNITSEGEEV